MKISTETIKDLLYSKFKNINAAETKNLIDIIVDQIEHQEGSLDLLVDSITNPANISYKYSNQVYNINHNYLLDITNSYMSKEILDSYEKDNLFIPNDAGNKCIPVKLIKFLPFAENKAIVTDHNLYINKSIWLSNLSPMNIIEK
jgi:hypothetical protein